MPTTVTASPPLPKAMSKGECPLRLRLNSGAAHHIKKILTVVAGATPTHTQARSQSLSPALRGAFISNSANFSPPLAALGRALFSGLKPNEAHAKSCSAKGSNMQRWKTALSLGANRGVLSCSSEGFDKQGD
jgi:hypothetical protein